MGPEAAGTTWGAGGAPRPVPVQDPPTVAVPDLASDPDPDPDAVAVADLGAVADPDADWGAGESAKASVKGDVRLVARQLALRFGALRPDVVERLSERRTNARFRPSGT